MYLLHSMEAILHLKSSSAIPNNPRVRKRESLFALSHTYMYHFFDMTLAIKKLQI